MDKLTVETTFFRSKSVHFPEEVTAKPFFRSISVQLNGDIGIFPLHTRSPHASADSDGKVVFRTIPVHFYVFFSYLCTGKSVNTSTYMAGTVKEMSLIKQVLQLKQLGESNRGIARKLRPYEGVSPSAALFPGTAYQPQTACHTAAAMGGISPDTS